MLRAKGDGERHMADIASMLDLLPTRRRFAPPGFTSAAHRPALQAIRPLQSRRTDDAQSTGPLIAKMARGASYRYVPVRSAGNSEMSFDRSCWEAEEAAVAEHFGVQLAGYREM
eukprot:SAG11_NODE_24173_length_377_cov_0.726619_1_plen_113_part_10